MFLWPVLKQLRKQQNQPIPAGVRDQEGRARKLPRLASPQANRPGGCELQRGTHLHRTRTRTRTSPSIDHAYDVATPEHCLVLQIIPVDAAQPRPDVGSDKPGRKRVCPGGSRWLHCGRKSTCWGKKITVRSVRSRGVAVHFRHCLAAGWQPSAKRCCCCGKRHALAGARAGADVRPLPGSRIRVYLGGLGSTATRIDAMGTPFHLSLPVARDGNSLHLRLKRRPCARDACGAKYDNELELAFRRA